MSWSAVNCPAIWARWNAFGNCMKRTFSISSQTMAFPARTPYILWQNCPKNTVRQHVPLVNGKMWFQNWPEIKWSQMRGKTFVWHFFGRLIGWSCTLRSRATGGIHTRTARRGLIWTIVSLLTYICVKSSVNVVLVLFDIQINSIVFSVAGYLCSFLFLQFSNKIW